MALAAASIAYSRAKGERLLLDVRGFGLTLMVLFLSDWLSKNYNLLAEPFIKVANYDLAQGPSIRGEILLGSLLAVLVLRLRLKWVFSAAAIVAPIIFTLSFFEASNGRLIFSDDHPTFLYRLSLLKQNFPSIPFYYPFWNGGLDAREFFATGAISIFIISAPFSYFFDIEQIYNYIVVFAVILLPALSCWAACKLEKIAHPGPAIAVLLAMASSLLWYKWGLKYGTMGFITAAALTPLNLSLCARLIDRRPVGIGTALLFVLTFSLMLLWSISGIVFLPVILLALFSLKRLIRKKNLMLVAFLLLSINLPWIVIFWSVSNVGSFLTSHKPGFSQMHELAEDKSAVRTEATAYRHKSEGLSLSKALSKLRQSSVSTNPLIFLFFLPGLFALKNSYSRASYAAVGVWLLILGSLMVTLKPQLELDRMLVVLALLGVVPVSAGLSALIRKAWCKTGLINLSTACLACGFLFASFFATNSVILNRSIEQYHFAEDIVPSIKEAILDNHRGGRVIVAGFILHELSNGHIAPLTEFTRVPLIASSPMHDKWMYEQVVPPSFIKRGHEGIDEYLDLYNVSAVIAEETFWRRYFRAREGFSEVWSHDRFVLFERQTFPDNYFLKGAGELLKQTTNSVVLRVNTSEAVVKFNYFPFLSSSSCQMSPYSIEEVTLIALQDCRPGEEVTIKSVSAFQRVFGR